MLKRMELITQCRIEYLNIENQAVVQNIAF